MNVLIVGTGNVAHYLTGRISATTQMQVWNWGRDSKKVRTLSSFYDTAGIYDFKKISLVFDLILLAVSDHAIAEVSKLFDGRAELIAHTSGAMDMSELKLNVSSRAVFYPLQTFSKPYDLGNNQFFCLLEFEKKEHSTLLSGMAKALGFKAREMDSKARLKTHLAAVLVNNFSNLLFHKAFTFLEESKINPELLVPLINETALKINKMHPEAAQTGPAKRNDQITIDKHLGLLEQHPDLLKIYKLFSQYLTPTDHDV